MNKGLAVWQDNGRSMIIDPDNLFWASARLVDDGIFIPGEALELYRSRKKQLEGEMKDLRFSNELTAIYIDPTDRCNANCIYCYVPRKTRMHGRSMTETELYFILDKLARYFKGSRRKQVIIFHASEPLLVKDIVFSAIEKYKNVFKFGLQTNATLLDKRDVDFLKERRVGVGISLDSHLPSTNNRQRAMREPGGNFDRVVRP